MTDIAAQVKKIVIEHMKNVEIKFMNVIKI